MVNGQFLCVAVKIYIFTVNLSLNYVIIYAYQLFFLFFFFCRLRLKVTGPIETLREEWFVWKRFSKMHLKLSK